MARPGVTKEQVWEAAEALAQEGMSPTVLNIRARLGSGSPNTIAPYLAEWRRERLAKLAEAWPEIPETVISAMRRLWEFALEETKALVATEREALAAMREEVERERVGSGERIRVLEAECERLRAEVETRAKALDRERQAHQETRAGLREASALAQERAARIQALERELEETRQRANSAQTNQAIATLAERAAHIEELRTRLEALQGRLVEIAGERKAEGKESGPGRKSPVKAAGKETAGKKRR